MDHHTRDQDDLASYALAPVTIERTDAAEPSRPWSRGERALPHLPEPGGGRAPVFVCLSHLRWDLVFQRPQHLLTRCARDRRVYFVEEPVTGAGPLRYEITPREQGVRRVVFHVPDGLDEAALVEAQRQLIDLLVAEERIGTHVLWYYTPMALPFTRHLKAAVTVYDCMDELSAFAGAPPAMRAREAELMRRADLVFTGGQSLFESKRGLHPQVYAFPSSVDVPHFARARRPQPDPADQADIPHPRIGFFGVIDERLDRELLARVAALQPDWHFVLLGPVVKVDPAALPKAPNLHYLGRKSYDDLPSYLAGWDVAMLPFAHNEATRYISPTKTPEYLAAGRPVVSTSIRDVVRPYGQQQLVHIADTAPDFRAAIQACLTEEPAARQRVVDQFLRQMSWDRTWSRMGALVDGVFQVKQATQPGALARGSAGAAANPPSV